MVAEHLHDRAELLLATLDAEVAERVKKEQPIPAWVHAVNRCLSSDLNAASVELAIRQAVDSTLVTAGHQKASRWWSST